MFSIFFSRDSLPLWIAVLMIVLAIFEFIRSGGYFWIDRSYYYLLLLVASYVISTYFVFIADASNTWLGRTPMDRALTTDFRLAYVVVVFIVFANFLANAPEQVFRKILILQISVGVLLALFGILQYVAFTFFHSTALAEIQPTNETYGLKSSLLRIGGMKVFRAAAIFSEPSWFGFYLIPITVKVIVARARGIVIGSHVVHVSILGILILAILSNLSMTALLSAALMVCLFTVKYIRRAPIFSITMVLVTGVVVTSLLFSPLGEPLLVRIERMVQVQDPSIIDRLVRVYTSIQVFLDHFWIGVGPGGYAFWYPRLGGLDYTIMASPLNAWLFILTDVGIIGFVPFMLFLWTILRRSIQRKEKNPMIEIYLWSIVSILILLTTLDFWYGEILWFELAIVLALCAGGGRVNSFRTAIIE